MVPVRVRFAPSPTGALHIGGIRTALYNYLFARQHGGTFILRIEDTDQNRYVPGAEAYILEALQWCGLTPDEGPGSGGPYGPYRQSERKSRYREYALRLVEAGKAYYAFDTEAELEEKREKLRQAGWASSQYDHRLRMDMRNSLSMDPEDVRQRLDAGEPHVIRLKVDPGEEILIRDAIRGEVTVRTEELDDKVLLKADGMPTYHLANIVDDRLMEITHVIRGEEWLPSTAHHVLLYRGLGWEDRMPEFAHLPLILRPDGKGKLSKRDGARFGMPVFPLAWKGDTDENSFTGFREEGFDPRAVVNFLAFLGWNPGTEQEIYSLEAMTPEFSLERIHKSGARFDYDKARWYNQQYLMATPDEELATLLLPEAASRGWKPDKEWLAKVCGLMKERVTFARDILRKGYYFFEPVKDYDQATLARKWQPDSASLFEGLMEVLLNTRPFVAAGLESKAKAWWEAAGAGPGAILPLYRIALAGTMKGPAVFEMLEVLGPDLSRERLVRALEIFRQREKS
ncbi:MAG: glutamate--tRNA ligase [Saprospiraceae bacterium]|nr:glutamate--tRNA ligase [Saprospiraceae bacterium]